MDVLGVCACFPGRWGEACEYYEGYVPPVQNDTIIIEEDDTTIYLRNLERSLEELRRRNAESANS
ncbi:hypothetical protein EON65_26430 [archaeon]|nr:MAG: hypothetical protein EON65_26430 [archaeon]